MMQILNWTLTSYTYVRSLKDVVVATDNGKILSIAWHSRV